MESRFDRTLVITRRDTCLPRHSLREHSIEALRAYRERTRKPNRAALTEFAQINRVQKVMGTFLEAVL